MNSNQQADASILQPHVTSKKLGTWTIIINILFFSAFILAIPIFFLIFYLSTFAAFSGATANSDQSFFKILLYTHVAYVLSVSLSAIVLNVLYITKRQPSGIKVIVPMILAVIACATIVIVTTRLF